MGGVPVQHGPASGQQRPAQGGKRQLLRCQDSAGVAHLRGVVGVAAAHTGQRPVLGQPGRPTVGVRDLERRTGVDCLQGVQRVG